MEVKASPRPRVDLLSRKNTFKSNLLYVLQYLWSFYNHGICGTNDVL